MIHQYQEDLIFLDVYRTPGEKLNLKLLLRLVERCAFKNAGRQPYLIYLLHISEMYTFSYSKTTCSQAKLFLVTQV